MDIINISDSDTESRESSDSLKIVNGESQKRSPKLSHSNNMKEGSSARMSNKLPTSFFSLPRNIFLLNQCQPLSIRVVDVKRYPSYLRICSKKEKHENKGIQKNKAKFLAEVFKNENIKSKCDILIKTLKQNSKYSNCPKVLNKLLTQNGNTLTSASNNKATVERITVNRMSKEMNLKRNKGLAGLKITYCEATENSEEHNEKNKTPLNVHDTPKCSMIDKNNYVLDLIDKKIAPANSTRCKIKLPNQRFQPQEKSKCISTQHFQKDKCAQVKMSRDNCITELKVNVTKQHNSILGSENREKFIHSTDKNTSNLPMNDNLKSDCKDKVNVNLRKQYSVKSLGHADLKLTIQCKNQKILNSTTVQEANNLNKLVLPNIDPEDWIFNASIQQGGTKPVNRSLESEQHKLNPAPVVTTISDITKKIEGSSDQLIQGSKIANVMNNNLVEPSKKCQVNEIIPKDVMIINQENIRNEKKSLNLYNDTTELPLCININKTNISKKQTPYVIARKTNKPPVPSPTVLFTTSNPSNSNPYIRQTIKKGQCLYSTQADYQSNHAVSHIVYHNYPRECSQDLNGQNRYYNQLGTDTSSQIKQYFPVQPTIGCVEATSYPNIPYTIQNCNYTQTPPIPTHSQFRNLYPNLLLMESSTVGNSVIGYNNNGIVRKINIQDTTSMLQKRHDTIITSTDNVTKQSNACNNIKRQIVAPGLTSVKPGTVEKRNVGYPILTKALKSIYQSNLNSNTPPTDQFKVQEGYSKSVASIPSFQETFNRIAGGIKTSEQHLTNRTTTFNAVLKQIKSNQPNMN